MNTLEKVESLLGTHESEFVKLIDKIESRKNLHEDLQTKLEGLGDTPIAEPDVNKAINTDRITLAKELLSNDEIKSFKAEEVGDFLYAVEQRVTSLQDEDGIFKSTPNTEECDLPNFLQVDELMKLGDKERTLKQNLATAKTEKQKKKAVNEIEKLNKEFKDKAMEISGLDVETMTEWEKLLVFTQVYTVAINASLSSVGKRSAF